GVYAQRVQPADEERPASAHGGGADANDSWIRRRDARARDRQLAENGHDVPDVCQRARRLVSRTRGPRQGQSRRHPEGTAFESAAGRHDCPGDGDCDRARAERGHSLQPPVRKWAGSKKTRPSSHPSLVSWSSTSFFSVACFSGTTADEMLVVRSLSAVLASAFFADSMCLNAATYCASRAFRCSPAFAAATKSESAAVLMALLIAPHPRSIVNGLTS